MSSESDIFGNDKVRIGPPAVDKDKFIIEVNGKRRKGKKYEIPFYLHNLGLNAYEFSAGRMARFSDNEDYKRFRENVEKYDIATSIHAPYYISLTSTKIETYEKSKERIAHTYAWATYLNAKRIVVHPGTYNTNKIPIPPNKKGLAPFILYPEPIESNRQHSLTDIFDGGKRSSQYEEFIKEIEMKIIEGIKEGRDMAFDLYPDLRSKFEKICICPETMGKHGQFGTVKEIVEVVKELGTKIARPCVDFGHIYARYLGKYDDYDFYAKIFEYIEGELGSNVIKNLHIHYSHVAFTKKGEDKHVPNTIEEIGPAVVPLLQYIIDNDLTPTIINESPVLEQDAVLIMKKYKELANKT